MALPAPQVPSLAAPPKLLLTERMEAPALVSATFSPLGVVVSALVRKVMGAEKSMRPSAVNARARIV